MTASRQLRRRSAIAARLAIALLALALLIGPSANAQTSRSTKKLPQSFPSAGHGEITGLGMPPMLMVFRVQDPSTLMALKAGDRITFTAGVINGKLTVLNHEMAK